MLRGSSLVCALLLTLAADAQSVFEECRDPNLVIPDGPGGYVSDVISFFVDAPIVDVEVDIDITHTWVGDLAVDISSPQGTTVRLHDEGGGSSDNIDVTYSDDGLPNGAPYNCACIMQPSGPGELGDFTNELSGGTWLLEIHDSAGSDLGFLNHWCIRLSGALPFERGDCNVDGTYDLADAIYLLEAMFTEGSPLPRCDAACDTDDSGALNIADAIRVIQNLFGSGDPPSPPFPGCGSAAGLACDDFPVCP